MTALVVSAGNPHQAGSAKGSRTTLDGLWRLQSHRLSGRHLLDDVAAGAERRTRAIADDVLHRLFALRQPNRQRRRNLARSEGAVGLINNNLTDAFGIETAIDVDQLPWPLGELALDLPGLVLRDLSPAANRSPSHCVWSSMARVSAAGFCKEGSFCAPSLQPYAVARQPIPHDRQQSAVQYPYLVTKHPPANKQWFN